MLTDTKLRKLKAQERLSKVVDRDGLYVVVNSGSASGLDENALRVACCGVHTNHFANPAVDKAHRCGVDLPASELPSTARVGSG